jgi:hypothetical protein
MRIKVKSDFENINEVGDLKDIKSPPLISMAQDLISTIGSCDSSLTLMSQSRERGHNPIWHLHVHLESERERERVEQINRGEFFY